MYPTVARRRAVSTSVILASVFGIGVQAKAEDLSWNTSTSGADFNTDTNWNPVNVPDSTDNGIFANNFNGTVTLAGPASVNLLSFRNTEGTVTFDGNGNTLSLTNALTGASGLSFILGTASGQVNTVVLQDITVSRTGSTGGNVLAVGNASGSHGNSLTIGAGASFIATSTAGTNIGIAGSNNNVLNVTDGGIYTAPQTVNVGVVSTSTGNQINISGANSKFIINNGSRFLNLRAGTITVDDGIADFGAGIDANDPSNTAVINFNGGTMYGKASSIDFAGATPFTIGNGSGTRATYGLTYSGGGFPSLTVTDGLVVNSDGALAGRGTVTGNVTGVAGAEIRPSLIGVPTVTTDDSATGTLTVNGSLDSSNFDIFIDLGDFPGTIADDTAPFEPDTEAPVDRLLVNGAFTHGADVTVNLADYVAPTDMDYELRIIGWTAGQDIGSPLSTDVTFVGGSPLAVDYRSDGIYVTAAVPEPATVSILGLALFGALARRRR